MREIKNEAYVVNSPENTPIQNDSNVCYLISYIKKIVIPASIEFHELLLNNQIQLHHAFSFTTILTHAIDYMWFIDREINNRSRMKLINEFDEIYSIQGAKYLNQKFKLLDGINNAFKHVELDPKKSQTNRDLIKKYGLITLNSLVEHNNKIYFIQDNHRFDYCRIVLKPIASIFDCSIQNKDDVIAFIKGKHFGCLAYEHIVYRENEYYEPHNAIDNLIEYCDPKCLDCGEFQSQCDCETFLYNGEKVIPNILIDETFDFDETMSQISGTREWSTK